MTFLFVLQHEMAHQQICKYYGGIPSSIYYEDLSLKASCQINPTKEYLLAQSINEMVGYVLFPIMVMLILIFLILVKKDNR